MQIYLYDRNTFEYLNTITADIDKKATLRLGYEVPLIPAFATTKPVPAYSENQIPVFVNDNWEVKTDYRKNFYKVTENFIVEDITTIGEQDGYYVVDKATGEAIRENSVKYKILNNNIVKKSDEEYLQDLENIEHERIMQLSLTKADVLLALYEDRGLTPENIKTMLADNVPALIKFDYASSYYRGDDVVIALGTALGYTNEEMDYLFENKEFPSEEPSDTDDDSDTDSDTDSDADSDADSDSDTDTDLDSIDTPEE